MLYFKKKSFNTFDHYFRSKTIKVMSFFGQISTFCLKDKYKTLQVEIKSFSENQASELGLQKELLRYLKII